MDETISSGGVERILAQLWAKLLEVTIIDKDDNFFMLGGQSVVASKLAAEVRRALDVDVPLKIIFQKPTLRELSEYIFRLCADKNLDEARFSSIPISNECVDFPLSYAQQRIWFVEKLISNTNLYHIHLCLHFQGDLDTDAVQGALDELVRRHESLRTTIIMNSGEPRQKILLPETAFPFKNHNVKNTRFSLQALGELVNGELLEPFDFVKMPLCRGTLFAFSKDNYVLLLVFHHMVFDGWSTGVFSRELAHYYNKLRGRKLPDLVRQKVKYGDYTIWQRKWLNGSVAKKQINYWKEQLDAVPALLLPLDYQRPSVQSYSGSTYKQFLSSKISEKLKLVSQTHGTTLFMTLLAGFQATLSLWTNQDDIVIGTPISNRRHAEITDMLGLFVNTLAIRTKIQSDETFISLLNSVKKTTLSAFENQDVPFEKLVDHLDISRNLSCHPIFQVFFILHNQKNEDIKLDNVIVSDCSEHIKQLAKFDLTVSIKEKKDVLCITYKYASDLFNEGTIIKLADFYESFLGKFLAYQYERLSTFTVINQKELSQIVRWNDTAQDYISNKSLSQVFERTVLAKGASIAALMDDEAITYAELNKRANQLAHYLVNECQITMGDRVAICLPRGFDLLIGLIAILKCGGTYIPLASELPEERLWYMLNNASANLLLLNSSVEYDFAKFSGKAVAIDEVSLQQFSDSNLRVDVPSSNLAYIIYTSGSTGRPKGVGRSHKSILNRLAFMWNELNLRDVDRCCLQASISVLDSGWEIWGTLLIGARIVLYNEMVSKNISVLLDICNKEKVTRITIVPSMLRELLSLIKTKHNVLNKTSINFWQLTGELLSIKLADEFFQLLPKGTQLTESYGTTEATSPLYRRYYNDGKINYSTLRAYNTSVYILDKNMRHVPIGTVGELYIGGALLAEGYINNEKLTAEKFVINPYAEADPKSPLLYRSGDLAKQLANGNIEFIGRRDSQIKIRGFRVEPEEIENVISEIFEIKQVVVNQWQNEVQQPIVVAYIMLESDAQAKLDLISDPDIYKRKLVQKVRDVANAKLPDYMRPGRIIVLKTIPLTANGKIDRLSLPIPEARDGLPPYEKPKDGLEAFAATIWERILSLSNISRYDNFFDLGGSSLSAIRVVTELNEKDYTSLSLSDIFTHPILKDFANFIKHVDSHVSELKDFKKISSFQQKSVPLSYSQEGVWFLEQVYQDAALYNIPVFMKIIGKLNLVALEKAIQTVVRRHTVLNMAIPVKNGVPRLETVMDKRSFENKSIIHLVETSELEPQISAERFVEKTASTKFDLSIGPLFRVSILKTSEAEHLLLMVFHHVIFDGESIGILNKELSESYNALCKEKTLKLPELNTQYKDYCLWQRKYLSGELLNTQLAFWKKQLANLSQAILPTDTRRHDEQEFVGAYVETIISRKALNLIKSCAKNNDVTLFTFLLAIFNLTLFKFSKQIDIAIGIPVAGRQLKNLENLIGLFTNTLVIRTTIDGAEPFYRYLHKLKAVLISAYKNQDVPFHKVVDCIGEARSLSIHPLFQIMFVMQNCHKTLPTFNELHVEAIRDFRRPAKLDLSLNAREVPNGLYLRLDFAKNIFYKETIQSILSEYESLVDKLVENSKVRVVDVLTNEDIELIEI